MCDSKDKIDVPAKTNQVVEDPFLPLLTKDQYIVDDLVESVVIWLQQFLGSDEFVKAREEFFCRAGKVFEADACFENRMNYFLDYFVFERPLTQLEISDKYEGQTPFEIFLDKLGSGEIDLHDGLIESYNNLINFRHSLFLINKVKDDFMIISDLLEGTKYTVQPKSSEIFRGFGKKEIIQTFVFPLGDIVHLSRGIIIHHPKATRTIKTHLKKSKKSPEFDENVQLCKLAQLQLKHFRLSHVTPERIYSEDSP